MVTSVAVQLQNDMQCEEVLEWFHGLERLDRNWYRATVGSETTLTIDGLADRIDRGRTIAYRPVQGLLQSSLVRN